MILLRRVISLTIVIAFAVGTMGTVGCTKYASPDDLQKLEEAKQAAVSAEKELTKVKADRKKVEQELAAQESELKTSKSDLKKVQEP